MKRTGLFAAFACLALVGFTTTTIAAGSNSGSGSSNSSGAKKKSCKKGQVYSKSRRKCVRTRVCIKGYVYSTSNRRCVRRKAGLVPDAELIDQAWSLTDQGRYDEAIDVFDLVSNRMQPEVLNGLGFSYRKLGALETALTYYQSALRLDPDYVLARAYLGKGYVNAGKLSLAREQLFEIGRRCGSGCEHYTELAESIRIAEARTVAQ